MALGAARDPLRPQTARADFGGAMHAFIVDAHRLEIRQPPAFRLIHGVADIVARLGSLPTYFTALGHSRQIVSWATRCDKRKC